MDASGGGANLPPEAIIARYIELRTVCASCLIAFVSGCFTLPLRWPLFAGACLHNLVFNRWKCDIQNQGIPAGFRHSHVGRLHDVLGARPLGPDCMFDLTSARALHGPWSSVVRPFFAKLHETCTRDMHFFGITLIQFADETRQAARALSDHSGST